MLKHMILTIGVLLCLSGLAASQSTNFVLTNNQQVLSNKMLDNSNALLGQVRVASTGVGTISVSTCGTGSPAIAGADAAFVITLGTGTPTACTVTFAATWTTSDLTCTFISETDGVMWKFAKVGSAGAWTGVTLTSSAALTNASKIHGLCVGHV